MNETKREDLCRHLRWKGLFVGGERDPAVPNPSDGFCWCVHTQNCLGPDGAVADRESCGPARSCFVSLRGR